MTATLAKQQIPESGGRGAPDRFATRAGRQEDMAFIFATWLQCYKHSSSFARHIPKKVYFEQHHAIVERLLARCEVLVCTLADSDSTIVGYVVRGPGILHFVYVKKDFRRMGVASGLLVDVDPNAMVFTHWTEGFDLILRKWPHMQYNPYLL